MAKTPVSHTALFQKINDALLLRDGDVVLDILSKNPNALLWADDTGKNLAHYAVALGHEKLLQKFIDMKGAILQTDHNGYRPVDVAHAFGRQDLVDILQMAKDQNVAQYVCGRLAYTSLADIRMASEKENRNILYTLVQQGLFPAVIQIAKNAKENMTTTDLLSTNKNGETVLFEICRQGQVEKLFDTSLWVGQVADFEKVLKNIPHIFLENIDVMAFQKQLRIDHFKSRRQKRSGFSL